MKKSTETSRGEVKKASTESKLSSKAEKLRKENQVYLRTYLHTYLN